MILRLDFYKFFLIHKWKTFIDLFATLFILLIDLELNNQRALFNWPNKYMQSPPPPICIKQSPPPYICIKQSPLPPFHINSFHVTGRFLHPSNYQKPNGFLVFLQGIKRHQRREMGSGKLYHYFSPLERYSLNKFILLLFDKYWKNDHNRSFNTQ